MNTLLMKLERKGNADEIPVEISSKTDGLYKK
jgi:hypothetical protein